jgi:transposase
MSLKKLDIAQIIDGAIPEPYNDKLISFGQLVEAMILNGLAWVGRTLHIYQTLSANVVEHLGLPNEGIHLDSTSIHVDGQYDEDNQAVKLVRGYSRDHRPESKRGVLNLITENKAGIPVHMQAASGNINDNESFKNIVKHHISPLKVAQDSQYFIADAALYTAQTMQSRDEQKQLFISRAPQK